MIDNATEATLVGYFTSAGTGVIAIVLAASLALTGAAALKGVALRLAPGVVSRIFGSRK